MVALPPEFARQLREERTVALVGVGINVAIAGSSILVGIFARSSAIIADGLHTCADLASDFTVLWGIRAAKQPADDCHHYGHARYEAMTAMFVGLLLFAAAVFVSVQSIVTLHEPHAGRMSWIPFWTAVAAIVLKEGMYWLTRAVGRKYRNRALMASAWHHRSDAFSSVAAAAGIGGAVVGGPRWSFLDHVTAIVLAAFLVVIGVRIVRESLSRLADRAPRPEVIEGIRRTISGIPGVRNFHSLRARHAGAGDRVEMDVHVQVDSAITVQQGHDIATRVEQEIHRATPDVIGVVVHIEPASEPEDRSQP